MRRAHRSPTEYRRQTRPAGRRPTRDFTRAILAVSVAAAATAGLALAGCSGSSATDSSAATDNREYVQGYGVGECTWPEEYEVTDDNPDIDVWEGVLLCREQMSDPRVTGEEEWTLVDTNYIHYTTIPQTGRFEASVVLTPDEGEGTWRGEGFGTDIWSGDGLHTVLHGEYAGEGEYEGLIYRVWGSQQPETGRYELVGYIEPAD
jgi:hypothetical protein